jgi:4-methylaminobutanoate oxidase (formaldehyde-forming)
LKESLPRGAAVVVIGGGILGCSIAWHLARSGCRDVVVLERNRLATGATARAAGFVTRGRLHAPTLAIVRRTREAIAELEEALGEDVGFRRVGSIRVAATDRGAADLAAMDEMLTADGVAVRNLAAGDVLGRVPWLDAGDARRVSYVEDDGYADPYRLTLAYAKAARRLGVRFLEDTAVHGLLHDSRRLEGVRTSAGEVRADAVINAAGAWAINVSKDAGHPMGTAPVRSHYYITAPLPAWPPHFPLVYLPDARAYARAEVGGLLLGVQESESRTYDARTLPGDIGDLALSDASGEWSVLESHAETLRRYIPELDALPLAHHITGLSTYTPDGRFLIGRAGPLEGFYVAGGCCGNGIAASGGIGACIASLVLKHPAPVDLTDFDPARFGAIDPYGEDFRARCAAARAGKLRLG